MGRTTKILGGAVAAAALAAPGAQAATWVVDDGPTPGGGCSALLFTSAHYTDLPPAVAAAQPGDTIYVCPGEYHGDVVSFKDGLKIRGAGDGVPGVTRAGLSLAAESVVGATYGITLEGDDALVSGLTIRADGDTPGIGVFLGGVNAVVRDTIVRGMNLGIALDGDGATATRNLVEGTTRSIGGINASADRNRIVDNTVRGNGGYGLVVNGGSASTTVTDNVATGNGFATYPNTAASDPADCKDFSTGTGTAGTASTWARNTGSTSKPAGLCAKPCPISSVLTPLQPVLNPLQPVLRPRC